MEQTLNEIYIKPEEAVKKLKSARNTKQTVYIYGAIGYGKTELIRQFLGRKEYYYFSCQDAKQKKFRLPPPGSPERYTDVVVIDDCQFLKDEERQKDILDLLEDKEIWLIIVGRNNIPPWLQGAYLYKGFTVISEKDLSFGFEEVQKLFFCYGLTVDEKTAQNMSTLSYGNAFAVKLVAIKMAEGYPQGDELYRLVTAEFMQYLENTLFVQWDSEVTEFLMQVSVVDEFDIRQAEMITGNHDISALLEKICELGNFVTVKEGIYRVRSFLLDVMRLKARRVYGEERVNEFLYNAGLYYEMHDELLKAAALYHQSGNHHRIREILIRNARKNPGNGQYYELRKYYLELKEEDIENSAVLMSAMSMLYGMLLQPENSEYWYQKLKKYEKKAAGSEKREAASQLLYLDIALTQRGSADLADIIKRVPAILFDNGMKLPEFSVTSNLPSVMNGGKDFCEWSKHDREMAVIMSKPVEKCLGKFSEGIVNAALGESLYEKGADAYEVLSLLNRGQMEAEAGGKLETAFACMGVQVRLNMVYSNEEEALNIMDSFEKKIKTWGVNQLLPNLRAMKCRIVLYNGDMKYVEEWMKEAPNEAEEFNSMERYRYLVKVRCYLAERKYMEAYALLEKLQYYAELGKRNYILIEAGLLRALTQYRMGVKEWQDTMLEVLKKANEYRFIRVISEEGSAASELLEQGKKIWAACAELDQEWLKRLIKETGKMATRYPVYLKEQIANRLDFSANAISVLRLQAEGYSINEIAKTLDMKVETVRYHSKQNYKKLGVSGKAEAVLAARNLKIL